MVNRNVTSYRFAILLMAGLAARGGALTVKDSTVFARPTHLIGWTDQNGKARKAALVSDGDHTGIIQFFSYYDGANLVSVTPADANADPLNSGFGSSCHHGATHYVQGVLTQRLVGAGIAMFDWVHAINGAVETITYAFMDGHDYFQWSETINATTGTMQGDSRGPYCTINWDGKGGPAEGVEYGAKRYFKQPTLTGAGYPARSGAWTLGGVCDIPYAWEWANGKEIGYLATQTFTQQNQGVPAWSDLLPASGTTLDPSGDQVWKTDYQMNFYDEWMKITWGQPYGWTNNTADATAAGCLKGGWGQYSLSIVLDAKAAGGVTRVRDENRAIQSGKVAFTAESGTIKAQGPVGTVNPAQQTLSPAGFDHNYRAWWLTAAGNQAALNLNLADSVSLVAPVLRIAEMTAFPSSVTLNGAVLIPGADYYASLDAANKEVWITLAKTLTGSNRIVLAPGNAGVTPGKKRESRTVRARTAFPGGDGYGSGGTWGWYFLNGSKASASAVAPAGVYFLRP